MSTLLSVNNLKVRYGNSGRLALNDITFSLSRGSVAAILGPSGCGKTTLLNAVAGLLGAKEAEIAGRISIFNLQNQPPNINIVFQKPTLLAWRSVFKNIAFGLEAKKIPRAQIEKRVKEIIAAIGLKGYEESYPNELSLGMQQRVNFARALVCRPDLLLLDEPFASLDAATKQKIQNDFSRVLKQNKITAIFVTHDPAEAARLADRLIIFSPGPATVQEIRENTRLL